MLNKQYNLDQCKNLLFSTPHQLLMHFDHNLLNQYNIHSQKHDQWCNLHNYLLLNHNKLGMFQSKDNKLHSKERYHSGNIRDKYELLDHKMVNLIQSCKMYKLLLFQRKFYNCLNKDQFLYKAPFKYLSQQQFLFRLMQVIQVQNYKFLMLLHWLCLQ